MLADAGLEGLGIESAAQQLLVTATRLHGVWSLKAVECGRCREQKLVAAAVAAAVPQVKHEKQLLLWMPAIAEVVDICDWDIRMLPAAASVALCFSTAVVVVQAPRFAVPICLPVSDLG